MHFRPSANAAESAVVGAAEANESGVGGVDFPEVPVQTENDPALRLLVEVWGELPDSVRNRILRLADDAVRVAR